MPSKEYKKEFYLLYFFAKEQLLYILSLVFLISALGLIPIVDNLMLKIFIDQLGNKQPIFGYGLAFWAVLYAVWWEVINMVARSYDYLYLRTMPIIKTRILDYFFNYLQYHDIQFFRDKMIGHLSNRITEAARSAEQLFAMIVERITRRVVLIIATLFTLYAIDIGFAIILASWIIVFGTINFINSSRIKGYASSYANSKNMVSGRIVDALSNINVIRNFSMQRFERSYLNTFLQNMVHDDQSMQKFMLKIRYLLGISCSIMVGVVVYHLVQLHAQNKVTVGDFVLVLGIFATLADDVWGLMQDIGDLFEELGAFSQAVNLLEPHSFQDLPEAQDLKVQNGTLEFRNVNFKYKYTSNLFTNLNCRIEGKQKVALVGFSGSGKTTFVSLLNRTYEIDSGQILIDNQDLKEVKHKSLQDNISFIPQEPILFNRSIRDNIKYAAPEVSDEEIIRVAKLAHIHDVIMKLPGGYDYVCGERGTALSGGQRQRIVIARAMLKNAPIQVLDEATSALDSITEHKIQQSLAYLIQDKTTLIIAHRLSTLPTMDRILVFDQGVIVEDGTHEELLAHKNVYFQLWHSQVNGMIP